MKIQQPAPLSVYLILHLPCEMTSISYKNSQATTIESTQKKTLLDLYNMLQGGFKEINNFNVFFL